MIRNSADNPPSLGSYTFAESLNSMSTSDSDGRDSCDNDPISFASFVESYNDAITPKNCLICGTTANYRHYGKRKEV